MSESQNRHRQLPIKVDEYLLTEELGSGLTATVYKTQNNDGRPLALKLYDRTSHAFEKSVDFDNELHALQ